VKNELETYKKKLQQSKLMHDELTRTYQTQFEALSQLITRLSVVCKGIDLELDNKLAKLRSALSKNANVENIEGLLSDVNSLLQQHGTRVAINMKNTQSSILDAGKKLQKIKGLPAELRRELRQLLKDVTGEHDSIISYIPQLDQLVQLYERSLTIAQKEGVGSTQECQIETIGHDISQELLNILSNLAFTGKMSEKIDLIREQLSSPIKPHNLVNCCVDIVKIIVSSISEERESAQSFLLTLNDALSSVHEVVSTSLVGAKKISEQKQFINETLKTNLSQVGEAINDAHDLETLKEQVALRIKDIANAVAEKESIEYHEQQILLSSLSVMEDKLAEIEKEADHYKKKLTEQKFKSLQDSLTKLPNRAAYDERIELEFKRWSRYKHSLCIAVADIDHFKRINDTYGHSAGDKTLQVIALALRKTLRNTDFVARYGGEEFVIVFPESKVEEIHKRLESLREQIRKIPFKFKNQNLHCTISIGATQFKEKDEPRTAFDRADDALYEAKRTGRDKTVITK
jgi:diguanylate cyclase (GGDEF)-like protein